jgi:hypothetical protein
MFPSFDPSVSCDPCPERVLGQGISCLAAQQQNNIENRKNQEPDIQTKKNYAG